MRKLLLGLFTVLAVLLPISQSAQAHWVYYHHDWGYQHVCLQRHCWHGGYWYGGYWHPGYWGWYPAPVAVVVAPY
jgi:hypothetical protein